jgi:hypothetical protein
MQTVILREVEGSHADCAESGIARRFGRICEETPCEACDAPDGKGSFDYVGVRFANVNFAQDDRM